MWRPRIFWRLFATYSLLVLLAIGLLGTVIVRRVEQHSLQHIEEGLRTSAVIVRDALRDPSPEQAARLQARMTALGKDISARITLIAADGRVLAESDKDLANLENHGSRPEVQEARTNGIGTATRYSTTVNRPMMYVALRADDAGDVRYVRVALPLDNVQAQLAGYRRIVWTAALLTTALALALAFVLARRFSQPLRELTVKVEQVAAGDYGQKVYGGGRDEVGALARAFNQMSERIATQFGQLEEDRQQLRAVLSGMVEGVVAIDAEERVQFVNERAAEFLSFPIDSAVGRKLWEVIRQRSIHELIRGTLAEPECRRGELNLRGPGAKHLAVHAAQLPGSPTPGAVLVFHDVTELRRLERLRQDFVANVSHELKTPLSVIKACVETLVEGAADDPQHRGPFLQQIADQSDRLHALILDLLSLARIEAGTEIFEFQEVPLAPLVTASLERHRARAEAKLQLLEPTPVDGKEYAAASTQDSVSAWADEEAVHEILDNLIDNALKYTPEGGRIRVGWFLEDGKACLQVADSGIGIPDQDLPRIFERFYRVDKARSRELGGTGLGLSIVKHLAQAMHGSVGVTSQVGKGTTFTVRLPRAPVA
jgi:two-component system phosphate regulon sensor histidine kinase PhoR